MAHMVPFGFDRTPYRSRAEIDDLVNTMDLMMSDLFGQPMTRASQRSRCSTFALDLRETDEMYLVDADLPGVSRDQVDLELHEGRLNISIAQEEESEEKTESYLHRERRVINATRSILLKDAADEGVRASLDQGVLHVEVPKRVKADSGIKIAID